MLSWAREALKKKEVKMSQCNNFWRSESDGAVKDIYLLHHGDTDATEKGYFAGWTDVLSL